MLLDLERTQSSTRCSITQESNPVGIVLNSSTYDEGNKNPFSPKNSQPGSPNSQEHQIVDQVQAETKTVVTIPAASESSRAEQAMSSSDNPFSSDAVLTMKSATDDNVSTEQTEHIFSRKTSQESNPFSPTATLPPVNVGLNNPFGNERK